MDDADTKTRLSLGTIGVLFGVAGVSIVSPGFKDAILSALNRTFDLSLYLDAPPWAGGLLIFVSLFCLTAAFAGQSRLEQGLKWLAAGKASTVGTFLAIKHVGFAPAPRDLKRDELPSQLARRDLQHLTIDLSDELSAVPPLLEAAVAKQLRMPGNISAVLGVNPQVDLGYCGIVQAPFQFMAGYQLTSWTRVRSFERHRQKDLWTALQEGPGPDLGVATTASMPGQGDDVAILVEITYPIDLGEVSASVPNLGRVVRVGISQTGVDRITHEEQVAEVARQFRDALDGARNVAPRPRIHVFCAAPMSVGFALGRMVSRTLHPPVRVYAYDRQAAKPYPWGIEINGTAGPGQVVRT